MNPTTPLTVPQLQLLHNDLHPARVAKRTQAGNTLSYLEAWDVRAMLIRTFGYAGFSADVIESRIVHESTYPHPNDPNKVLHRIGALCTFRLTIHQTGATYTETAIASQAGPDWGAVADFATKSAESDALKRAAINLGTQFGLSLYDNGQIRDVVRKVVAPDQGPIVEDIVIAANDTGKMGNEARARMQERLKVTTPDVTPDTADVTPDTPDVTLPATTPEQAERDARQEAAVAALADAETKTGLTAKETRRA